VELWWKAIIHSNFDIYTCVPSFWTHRFSHDPVGLGLRVIQSLRRAPQKETPVRILLRAPVRWNSGRRQLYIVTVTFIPGFLFSLDPEVIRNYVWGPSGTLLKEQGSFKLNIEHEAKRACLKA